MRRGPRVVPALVLAILLAAAAAPALAQSVPSTDARVEVAIGGGWIGGGPLGGGPATLTSNQGSAPYVLFTTTADLGMQAGADLRAGYRVSRAVLVSVAAGLTRGDVTVGIAGDAEGAPDTRFVGETLLQWQIEGRVDVDLTQLRFARGRARPFVMASGGILRQYHETRVSTESGHVFQAGAGLSYMLRERPAGLLAGVGVTAEVRVCHVRGGFTWGPDTRTVPAFGVGFLTRWGRR